MSFYTSSRNNVHASLYLYNRHMYFGLSFVAMDAKRSICQQIDGFDYASLLDYD